MGIIFRKSKEFEDVLKTGRTLRLMMIGFVEFLQKQYARQRIETSC